MAEVKAEDRVAHIFSVNLKSEINGEAAEGDGSANQSTVAVGSAWFEGTVIAATKEAVEVQFDDGSTLHMTVRKAANVAVMHLGSLRLMASRLTKSHLTPPTISQRQEAQAARLVHLFLHGGSRPPGGECMRGTKDSRGGDRSTPHILRA